MTTEEKRKAWEVKYVAQLRKLARRESMRQLKKHTLERFPRLGPEEVSKAVNKWYASRTQGRVQA